MSKTRKNVSSAKSNGKKWVLAVDPYSDLKIEPLLKLVKPLAEQSGAKLHALYVLAPAALNWNGEFSGPWMTKYRPMAEAKLEEYIQDKDVTRQVVACKNAGQAESINCLIRHVSKLKADRLVISTHSRTGLERMAMGSFTEMVILTSKTPVLVVNPNHKLPATVRKILVPTDLSKKNAKFIDGVADYAKRISAGLVLFHKQPDPLDPIIQQGVYSLGGGWVSVQSYIDDEMSNRDKQIGKIEEKIRSKDVAVSHVLDSSSDGLIDSINKAAASSGADMISVLTQSEGWSAALLGSVARGLVRTSDLPILVQR